jgi:hypothetical protein
VQSCGFDRETVATLWRRFLVHVQLPLYLLPKDFLSVLCSYLLCENAEPVARRPSAGAETSVPIVAMSGEFQ